MQYLELAALAVWLCVKCSFLLWVFFLAVMKLRDVRDAGKLNGQAKYPATLVLCIGYALDFAVNMVPATILFLELPRELTVSERTKRHREEQTFRGSISRWLRKGFLAIADTSGAHN